MGESGNDPEKEIGDGGEFPARGLPQVVSDGVSGHGAEYRTDCADQRVAERFGGASESQGDQQDVGRNRKKAGFGECEDEQCGRSPAAVGPAEHPVVGFFQNIHAVNVAHRARCGFNGASLPKIFQTGASQRVKSDRNDRVYVFTEHFTAGSRRGCLLRRPDRRRRKRRAVLWPGPRPVRGVRRATTARRFGRARNPPGCGPRPVF